MTAQNRYFCGSKKSSMKKIAYMTLLVAAIATLSSFFSPDRPVRSTPAGNPDQASVIPDSVMKVLERACMDCHKDGGSAMARGKLNLSQWAKMTPEKQVKKAVDICMEVTKGSMPPKKWRANNPDKVPTSAESEMICRWAKSIQQKP